MKTQRIPDFLPDRRPFVIAEAGVNHNGQLQTAKQLIDAASEAGADAVKFQAFNTEQLVSPQTSKARYQKEHADASQSQYEMLKTLELSRSAHNELQEYCDQKNIRFLSTPYDPQSADFLDEIGVPFFKIGSSDTNNYPFLKYIAGKQKPIILSTGMSTLSEVGSAVEAITEQGQNENLVLLHCTSNYPANPRNVHLRAMKTLKAAFQHPVGYSDHTTGTSIPAAATALGACVIEKHFTLDKTMDGPDHAASLEPDQLQQMIKNVRTVRTALGSPEKKPVSSERKHRETVRKSIITTQNLGKGTCISEQNVTIKRPGTGIDPGNLDLVCGIPVQEDLSKNTPLQWHHLKPGE